MSKTEVGLRDSWKKTLWKRIREWFENIVLVVAYDTKENNNSKSQPGDTAMMHSNNMVMYAENSEVHNSIFINRTA